ncbi:pyrroline-5-carboxylate reductase [Tepidibacter formicigenes]|jgi:pyrroline-5-carboxylate reductase|uniref:Pyrroline-5-carboxylate reductase n=1 Tax=Tepidibacter formicigenes DSM 15518 TaxID=1123349 RepID=A0A1M6M8N8_9FIRM|nr:pyrroline-5-carboxylate reductase [Tepidibacter formicigenes]SHJ79835.1 pyrroline-5-carboxylate reductase [Tepidibacter formicigenes DSM 15518]
MNKVVGFIGCGNMAKAMIGGIVKSGLVKPENIIVSDRYKDSLDFVFNEYGVKTTKDNKEVAKTAHIIVLSVKPNIYDLVISEIKDIVSNDVIIVTIAAGKSIKNVEDAFGKDTKIIRTMPNTPALVGEGMTAISPNEKISQEEIKDIIKIFESFGKIEIIDEKLMNAFVSTSGSSPAYVFMFIEAMADAAVLDGMPRNKAYKMAAQSVLGAAKMVLETGKHPGELKDMVCSPGGTTIEAVASLEEDGFRSSIIKAMRKCAQKSKTMSS